MDEKNRRFWAGRDQPLDPRHGMPLLDCRFDDSAPTVHGASVKVHTKAEGIFPEYRICAGDGGAFLYAGSHRVSVEDAVDAILEPFLEQYK